jgi:hypothetical protein
MNEQQKYAVFVSPSLEKEENLSLCVKEMQGDLVMFDDMPLRIEDCPIDKNVIACIANCSAEDVKNLTYPKFFFKALMSENSEKYLFNAKKVTSLESLFYYNGAKDFVKNVLAAASKKPTFNQEVKGYGVYSRTKDVFSQFNNLKNQGLKIEKIAIVKDMVFPVIENTQVYKENKNKIYPVENFNVIPKNQQLNITDFLNSSSTKMH